VCSTNGAKVMVDERDKKWLAYAAKLAIKGRGRVHPNPMVGCVLVKENRLVGGGWHQEYGNNHAEVIATTNAQADTLGSTAYVTLEPCNHEGKTGPCSEHLIKMGVQKVVFAASEPGVAAAGGAKRLKEAGIEVRGPVDDFSLGEGVDPAFFYSARYGHTYLALKLAVSKDDKIAKNVGTRTFLTGEQANTEVHRIRSGFDGIVVGANTLRVDDPFLTVRQLPYEPRVPPTRIVISSDGDLCTESNLFRCIKEFPVLVIVGERTRVESINKLRSAGACVEVVRCAEKRVDLAESLQVMWEKGLKSVMCEGGAELAQAFCALDLAQRLYLFRTERILGTKAVPVFSGGALPWNSKLWKQRGTEVNFGKDMLTVYDRER